MVLPIETVVALVTGASRGLGRALAEGLLQRGARKVYAASRTGEISWAGADDRLVPLALDVTEPKQLRAAAEAAADVNVLINNAGLLASYGVLGSDVAEIRRDMETNFYGVLDSTSTLLPALQRNAPAAVVNVLSVVSLASMPGLGGYSASKAAAWSLTQSLRAELAAHNVRVHAVFPGPIDTDMIRSLELDKTPAPDVARAILDALLSGELDVFPDPLSAEVGALWRQDPRAIERRFGAG